MAADTVTDDSVSPEANTLLEGRRVTMLVWNGFLHDARVTREAETLIRQGAHVRVVCIHTGDSPVSEITDTGVEIERVSRRLKRMTRILLAPRGLYHLLLSRSTRGDPAATRSAMSRRSQWWEFDRKLAMAFEMCAASIRMARESMGFQPDIVHANDVNTLIPGWISASLSKVPLVYDAHEISADREGYRGRIWLVKLAERLFGGAAAGKLTTTQLRADWFERNYGFENVAVVQNRPAFSAVSSNLLRQRYPIPDDALLVLYQGGLQPGRGLHNLIEAVRPLDGVHLVFVGDGRQRESLERSSEDIRARVHFVGQVPLNELPCWTASADLGVQALRNTCLNHYTTDSNKLFEYVMGGLPVIASDFPEIRKVVLESGIGVLVDPDNVSQISSEILKFSTDREMLAQCSENAKTARHRLDWASQEPAFLGVYLSVVANGA